MEDNITKNVRNLFILQEETDDNTKKIRDIRNLFLK